MAGAHDFLSVSLGGGGQDGEASRYEIERQTFTQAEFDRICGVDWHLTPDVPQKASLKARGREFLVKRCSCSLVCWKTAIRGVLPSVRWLKEYDVKDNFMPDVLAGLTVAVMNIPQGMAYALLANVEPVCGLYVSFFPVLIYFLMGTSRHISLGTFAVVSLMVGNIVSEILTPYSISHSSATSSENMDGGFFLNSTNITAADVQGHELTNTRVSPPSSIGVAVAVAFFVGVFQIIMGLLGLGFVTMYMSTQMLRAFTCGAAIHVFSSQIKYLFGVSLDPFGEAAEAKVFKLIYYYVEILPKIFRETNLSAFVISLISITTMVIVKELISDKFKEAFHMPFPIELIVVIVATGISFGAKFHDSYDTDIIGEIPTGLPTPSLPPLQSVFDRVGDCFAIAVVSFVIDVSLADLFAKRHRYEINANQELLALGSANLFGSFFSSFPSCASLSRSLVQEGAGGRTQVASVVSASVILVVLLAIGPLFESLPNAILASIIIVNLKGMFLQLRDLIALWHSDFLDFLIWLFTFTATVLLDVMFGLLIGVGFSLLTVVFRTQSPNAYLLGRIGNSNIYRGIKKYKCAQEIADVKIFRFEAALYFANTEFFKNRLFSLTEVNPTSVICRQRTIDERLRRLTRQRSKSSPAIMEEKFKELSQVVIDGEIGTTTHPSQAGSPRRITIHRQSVQPVGMLERHVTVEVDGYGQCVAYGIRCIIIDCSMFGYVDTAGTTTLIQLINDYWNIGIDVYLVACQEGVLNNLRDQKFFDSVPSDTLHISIHDAILYVQQKLRSSNSPGESLPGGPVRPLPQEPLHGTSQTPQQQQDQRLPPTTQQLEQNELPEQRGITPSLQEEEKREETESQDKFERALGGDRSRDPEGVAHVPVVEQPRTSLSTTESADVNEEGRRGEEIESLVLQRADRDSTARETSELVNRIDEDGGAVQGDKGGVMDESPAVTEAIEKREGGS